MLVFTIKIYGKDMEKGKRKKTLLLPLITIIPFLSFFLYSLYLGSNPISVIYANILPLQTHIRYDTFTVSFDESVPEYLREEISNSLKDINFEGKERFKFVDGKGKYLVKNTESDSDYVVLENTLVPVGHIYWLRDSVSESELKSDSFSVILNSEDFERNKSFITEMLGSDVNIFESSDLISDVKKSENSIGFIRPSEISKEMKVLKLNDKQYLNTDEGAFNVKYVLESEQENIGFVYSIVQKNLESTPLEVFDSEKIVKINMTGVTAISRGLARKIDSVGDYDYPAQKIGSFLADADLTHTSNEVSFVDGCAVYSGMRFCSNPKYMETLKSSGIDIVGLTGNHNNDFGATNNAKSIEMYKDEGMDYYGGGLNSTDASKILYKEVKGSTIAFLGYNYYDTMLKTGALAAESRAGANSYAVEKMQRDISEANENADVVIVDFQFQECYSYPSTDVIYPICYKPLSSPDQKGVFRKAIDLGADVVVGTQAHQPQTYEVYNGGLIYYGLGNLYFDQTRWIGTRQGLVLSLYVMDGELIQGELTPTIYENDMIVRFANEQESKVLLEQLMKARTF